MKTTSGVLLMVSLLLCATVAVASDRPGEFQVEFTYPTDPAPPVDIFDNTVHTFPLTQTLLTVDPSNPILYLELEISGLSHTAPMDLQVLLAPPHSPDFGLILMDDAGWFGAGFELVNVDLLFADQGIPLPHRDVEGPILPHPDTIYRPDGPGVFSQYYGQPVGTDPWLLVLIDDRPRDSGSFESIALRGAVVPEPMSLSLSLLALGAIAVFRWRRV
jgi:hypothetical protein